MGGGGDFNMENGVMLFIVKRKYINNSN